MLADSSARQPMPTRSRRSTTASSAASPAATAAAAAAAATAAAATPCCVVPVVALQSIDGGKSIERQCAQAEYRREQGRLVGRAALAQGVRAALQAFEHGLKIGHHRVAEPGAMP